MENKSLYPVIIFSLFSFFLILLILSLILQNRKNQKATSLPTTTPTLAFPTTHPKAKTRLTPSPTLSPLPSPSLTPIEFTGVKEEKLPKEVVDFSQQKLELMKKLPLETEKFTIDFDYDNDRFIVKLKAPYEENKREFNQWLDKNYPAIPKNQFVFQSI